jgi:hypothetical protein
MVCMVCMAMVDMAMVDKARGLCGMIFRVDMAIDRAIVLYSRRSHRLYCSRGTLARLGAYVRPIA